MGVGDALLKFQNFTNRWKFHGVMKTVDHETTAERKLEGSLQLVGTEMRWEDY